MSDTCSTFSVTVYSTAACMQCKITMRALREAGIAYCSVDVTKSASALAYITDELGYSSAPVVVVNQDSHNHWSGFQPDQIQQLAAAVGKTRRDVDHG